MGGRVGDCSFVLGGRPGLDRDPLMPGQVHVRSLPGGDFPVPRPGEPLVARTVRVLAAMVMAGGALALFVQTLRLEGPLLESFVKVNFMSDEERVPLFAAVIGAALVAGLLSSIYLAATRWEGLPRLEWLMRASRPVLPLAVPPTLLAYDFAYRSTLVCLVLLAIFAVMTEWSLRDALSAFASPWRVPSLAWPSTLTRHLPMLLVVGGAIFYAVYFSYYTLLNHRRQHAYGARHQRFPGLW